MKFTTIIFIFLSAMTPISFAEVPARKVKPTVEYDINGAAGTYNCKNYSEVGIAMNYNITDWLTWRNAAFHRFTATTTSATQRHDFTGLDSTLRLISTAPFDGGAFHLFGGAGYRFATESKTAIIGETGVGFNFGRFGLGGGVKYLSYDQRQIDSKGVDIKKDDLSYFLTVSVGAGLSFLNFK